MQRSHARSTQTSLKHEQRTHWYRTGAARALWERSELLRDSQHLLSSCPGDPELLEKKGKQMSDRKG